MTVSMDGNTGADIGQADAQYVHHECFASPRTCRRLFGPQAEYVDLPVWDQVPETALDDVVTPVKRPAVSRKDEQTLFLRYNYARYRLASPLAAGVRRRWQRRAASARADLVQANLALVPAMIRRARIGGMERSELISEGNMALLRSIDAFDVSRGFRFSTYACCAILRSFTSAATKTGRYRRLFPVQYDPELERSDADDRRALAQREDRLDVLREILTHNHARLGRMERSVLRERFAMPSGRGGKSLVELGRQYGLTRERIRQIQARAIKKIRAVVNLR